jgi:hypothetical protein
MDHRPSHLRQLDRADLTRLRTLDDGEYIDDFRSVESALKAAIEADQIGLVLLDALLDHVPGGGSGYGIYNPKSVCEALKPIRHVVTAKKHRRPGAHASDQGKPVVVSAARRGLASVQRSLSLVATSSRRPER